MPAVGRNYLLMYMNSWKIRFLVRTHKFLNRFYLASKNKGKETVPPTTKTKHKCLPFADEVEPILPIVKAQLVRIEDSIWRVLRYLIRALLKPDSETWLMPKFQVPSTSNYYYVMITLWYVAWNFQDWDWSWGESTLQWRRHGSLFKLLPPDNWSFDMVEEEKLPFLKWYHYGSILLLCQNGIMPSTIREPGLEAKVIALSQAARISAAAKLSSSQQYKAEDEIIDRLSFLSDELGLEPRGRSRVGTIASLAMKRVKQRDHTRALNPGWLAPTEFGFTSGPWEIHALCHHSRLVVTSLEEKDPENLRSTKLTSDERDEEISTHKARIYRFLNSEGTLVPCWERAHTVARKGFLRSEANAVLASTLLMLNEMDLKQELGPGDGMFTAAEGPEGQQVSRVSTAASEHGGEDRLDQVVARQGRVLQEFRRVEIIMQGQRDALERITGESTHTPVIEWKGFAVPRRYHPDSFLQSLEDTPERYDLERLRSSTIPASLHQHATLPQNLEVVFDYNYLVKCVKYFQVIDLAATGPEYDADGFTWELVRRSYDGSKAELIDKVCKSISKMFKRMENIRKSEGPNSPQLKQLESKYRLQKAERKRHNLENSNICWALYDSVSNGRPLPNLQFQIYPNNPLTSSSTKRCSIDSCEYTPRESPFRGEYCSRLS